MNGAGAEALREKHKAPQVSPLPSPEATSGTPTVTAFGTMQATLGNAALASAGINAFPAQAVPPILLQNAYGNAAVARAATAGELPGGANARRSDSEDPEAVGALGAEDAFDGGGPAAEVSAAKRGPDKKSPQQASSKLVNGPEQPAAERPVERGGALSAPKAKEKGTGPSLPEPPTFQVPALEPITLPAPLLLAPPDPALRPKRYDLASARAEVATMLGQLAASAERKKGPVRANAAAFKEQIARNGLSQRTAALRLVSQTRMNIAGEIKQAQAAVSAHAKSYKAVAQTQAAAAFAQVVAASSTQAGAVEQSKKTHQGAARKAVWDRQDETRKFGRSEGKRGREAVEAQARDALARGANKAASYRSKDPERDQVQANAVQYIANATAAELLKPAASIESEAIEQGNQLADGFAGAADKAVAAIEEQSLQITQQVVGAAPTQLATFQGIGAATGEAIDSFAASIVAELAGVERESNRQLHSVGVSLMEQIDGAVATVQGSVDQQVVALEESIDRIVERTGATAMAAQRPDPEGLRKALVTVDGMLDDACDGFNDGLDEMEDGAAQIFEDAVTIASTDLAQVETSTSGGLARVTAATVDGMQALIDKQEEETGKFITKWTEGLASAQKEVDAKWDSIVTGVGDKINEELKKVKPEITKGVDDSVAENKEPLDELEESMNDAAEKAAYKYDKPIRAKLKSVFWGALKALATLVLVVAAVIVAIALIIIGIVGGAIGYLIAGIVLLVVAVGFVVYGIVSGIVRRIQSANTVFDGIRGFFIGILDITGIPNIIEGFTEQDMVNGNTLTVEEAGERLGGGIVALLTIIIPFAKGLKGMRGAPKVPIELAPEIRVGPEPLTGPGVKVPKVELPPTEVPKVEVPTTEVPKTEVPKTEVPKTEAPKTEVPKTEAPKTEAPKTEAPKTEVPKTEVPKTEAPKTEAPKTEVPKTEVPKTEAPKTEVPKTEVPKTEAPKTEVPKTEVPKTEAPKTEAPKTDVPKVEEVKTPEFPKEEFSPSDPGWQKWPPPEPSSVKPKWNEPGGARWRYDRYRYDKWMESGKSKTPPTDLMPPKTYFDRHVAPKARGQSPGEMGSPEHRAAVEKVREENNVGTQTMGEKRPDAVGNIDQPLKVAGKVYTPKKGGRVLYEADNFFKDSSQLVSEAREQVRQFRKDNPDATIVVEDAANPGKVIVYEPGTQPPPPGPLKPNTPSIEPVK